jgi:hypothetical protein
MKETKGRLIRIFLSLFGMNNGTSKNMLLFAGFFSALIADAQVSVAPQVLSSGGKDFQNAQFQLTYTIGELSAVSTLSNGNSIATQGFNQPDKFTIAFVEENEWAEGLILYPNPAANQVTIDFDATQNTNLRIEILDQTGRLVLPSRWIASSVLQQSVSIPIQHLAAGVYTAAIWCSKNEQCKTIRFTKLP